jgi:hypothetical protein
MSTRPCWSAATAFKHAPKISERSEANVMLLEGRCRRATKDDRRWEYGVLLCFLMQAVVFLLFKQAPSPGETQCSGKRAGAIGRVQPRSIRTDWLLRAQRAQRSGQ